VSAKEEKRRVLANGAEYAMHSLNHESLRRSLGMEKKFFGKDRKAAKSRRRKGEQSGMPGSEAVLVFPRDTNGLL